MKNMGFAVFAVVLLIAHTDQLSAANFTGTGGRGTRIAIMPLGSRGLSEAQEYLPYVVQGELLHNFRNFSAMSILDRLGLPAVLMEIESGIYSPDADFGTLGQIAGADYFLMGEITATTVGYALQLRIMGTGRDTVADVRASFSGTTTVVEMSNFTGIRRASMELLTQMGVNLTSNARQQLTGAADVNRVNGEIALARGIAAQRRGTEVAALSYFFQAAVFDPTLLEAVNRSSVLYASIRGGNIGDDVRSEIAWRRAWVERLAETEQFFADFHQRESMPYTLFYTVEITQGAINWQTETVNLSIETHLHGSGIWTVSLERALQAVHDGLMATRRAQTWELSNWPWQGVTNLDAFARRNNNFSVVFELLNDQNMVIGRQTLQTGGSWELSWTVRPIINVSASDRRTLNFHNVNANDISDRMTIRVASINGIAAETATRDGVLQIRAVSRNDFVGYDRFMFARGEIQGFTSSVDRVASLTIPNTIWGDPVISIGARAFNGTGLANVTIHNGVTYIGNEAFLNNDLAWIRIGANVTMGPNSFGGGGFCGFPEKYNQNGRQAGIYEQSIFRFVRGEIQGFSNIGMVTGLLIPDTIWGNRVTSIAAGAFRNAGLTNVSIPGSVTHIRSEAFSGNNLVHITIPNGVTYIGAEAFRGNAFQRINIPNSVTFIGRDAFWNDSGRVPSEIHITIGANVAMAGDPFRQGRYQTRFVQGRGNVTEFVGFNRFLRDYSRNNRHAGTYTYITNDQGTWIGGIGQDVRGLQQRNTRSVWLGGLAALGGLVAFFVLLL